MKTTTSFSPTVLCLLGVLLTISAARAEMLPTYPIRSLVINSSTIVLAEPADPAKLEGDEQAFKVIEVLKGQAIKDATSWGKKMPGNGIPSRRFLN